MRYGCHNKVTPAGFDGCEFLWSHSRAHPAGLLATLELVLNDPPAGRQLQVDGSGGKVWIIRCHCQADPEDSRIILCELREKLPLASMMTWREVTFRPTTMDEDLQQQELALRFHAAPLPENVPESFLPIQVLELLDVYERYVYFLLAGPIRQMCTFC